MVPLNLQEQRQRTVGKDAKLDRRNRTTPESYNRERLRRTVANYIKERRKRTTPRIPQLQSRSCRQTFQITQSPALVVILHGIKKVMIQEGREETTVRQDGEEHCGGWR